MEEHFHKVYISKTETNLVVYYLISAETSQKNQFDALYSSPSRLWTERGNSHGSLPIYSYAIMQKTKQVGIFVNFCCRYTKHVFALWHWLHTDRNGETAIFYILISVLSMFWKVFTNAIVDFSYWCCFKDIDFSARFRQLLSG